MASASMKDMSEEQLARKRDEVNVAREEKRKQMMNAMAQRRENRSNRTKEQSKQAKEQINTFLEMFTKEFDIIENTMEQCNDYESFQNLQLQRYNLEEKLADAARFLPLYTFETKSKQLQKLKQLVRNTQIKVAPKPKFKFSEQNVNIRKQNNDNNNNTDNNNNNNNSNDSESKIEENNIDLDSILKSNGNDNEIRICDKNLETILLDSGSVNGSDVCLSNLSNCQISIVDHIGALRMDHIKFCTIVTGPISSSLLVEHIENSKVHSAMRQCRIHNAKKTAFYIHVNSEPVIEHSDDISFAPYNVEYNDLRKQWDECDVDKNVNKWDKVKDFNWFKQSQSPHWSLIPLANRIGVVNPIENEDDEEL